jgi:hypothetical protein
MLNVIFRCRERMAIVYGRVAPGTLAGSRFAEREPTAVLPKGKPRRPGHLSRNSRGVSLKPMPRRVA